MRKWVLLAVCLAASLPTYGKKTDSDSKALLKDPRALLGAAAPFYNFSDSSLKPWYMHVTYQLYDDSGKPAQRGAFDYWWGSPKIYRMGWSRGGSAYTIWHTADGRESYEAIGDQIQYFERQLESALLAPLPTVEELDRNKSSLERKNRKVGQQNLPCFMVIPQMPLEESARAMDDVPLGMFPTYCFDSSTSALRMVFSWDSILEVFNRVAKVQGRYLPQDIRFFEAGRPILSATVETVSALDPSDPGLKPAPDAKLLEKPGRVPVDQKTINGYLTKKVFPLYPADAKEAHVSGTVEMRVVIGTDGAIHEIQVVKAPWPSLVASAMWAVSQWQYKPYMLNGKPVEVETTIHVIFTLGG